MKFKVAAIQMASEIGRVQENVAEAKKIALDAIEAGAKIICLPEMFNTGYFSHTSHADVGYLKLAEPRDGFTVSTFQALAQKYATVMVVPFVEYDKPGVYYNAAAVIDADGALLGVYHKLHIPWSHTGWEKFYFRPGEEIPVFKTRFAKLGVIICYDRDFPEVSRILGLKGAEIMLIPNGASIALTETWKSIVQTRAYENQFYVLGACMTGRTDAEHYEFMGSSVLVDPFGKIIKVLQREPGILLEEIDTENLLAARQSRFLYRDRRPEIYQELLKLE